MLSSEAQKRGSVITKNFEKTLTFKSELQTETNETITLEPGKYLVIANAFAFGKTLRHFMTIKYNDDVNPRIQTSADDSSGYCGLNCSGVMDITGGAITGIKMQYVYQNSAYKDLGERSIRVQFCMTIIRIQ